MQSCTFAPLLTLAEMCLMPCPCDPIDFKQCSMLFDFHLGLNLVGLTHLHFDTSSALHIMMCVDERITEKSSACCFDIIFELLNFIPKNVEPLKSDVCATVAD